MAALDVTASLMPERAALLELLRSLGASEWDQPTECPAWTVKGIALHILGDDVSLLSRQRDVGDAERLSLRRVSSRSVVSRTARRLQRAMGRSGRFMSTRLVIESAAVHG